MSLTRTLTAIALLGLALTASPAAAQRATINVGYIPLISYAPFFIALEKGYYREQDLEVNLARFGHAGQMMGPMTSGEMHVGSGGIAAGLFNAAAEGLRHKVVADKGYMFRGYGFNFVVVRKDLADAIKDLRDFKGRTIGMNAPGSPVRFYLNTMLKRAGLTEKDIRPLYLDFAKMPVALKEKGIDLAVIVDPHGTRAVQAGYGTIFRNTNQEPFINQQVAVIYYAESFMKQKPDLARKFMVAYVKACRYYNDQRNLPELAKIMAGPPSVRSRRRCGPRTSST
ncbi:MAG: ABC transporter substrate-binding protein [Deltaproteobacteria bacterium]|nr:ABC transporter substrate-binding protein [Deltaproteobacteria bacterium]